MVITQAEQVAAMIQEWPTNESSRPGVDDECARREAIRLSEWWLSLPTDGLVASINAGPTEGKAPHGWHMWFELAHPSFTKPCRCFRILVQHLKPPRVYQLQFPMEAREFPDSPTIHKPIRELIQKAQDWALSSNLRDNVENKTVKSIDIYRQFSEVQFLRFTEMVKRFVSDLRVILDPPPARPVKEDA
jgi:hypothetical protein